MSVGLLPECPQQLKLGQVKAISLELEVSHMGIICHFLKYVLAWHWSQKRSWDLNPGTQKWNADVLSGIFTVSNIWDHLFFFFKRFYLKGGVTESESNLAFADSLHKWP